MGKTFRTTRCFGSSQPFAAAASRPGHVLDENGAVDYPDAATLDPAEGRADRGTRHPSRTAPSERRQRVAVAVYHQARIANAALDGQTQQDEFGYLFSETFDGLVGNLAGVGLDVSVSRRRSEGVCISYIEPAHPRLCADNRHRQERRDSESPLLACLDYPWNPAVFAAGQRCRLLRGLQGAAHFWSVRAAVFVSGDPAHLPARRPTAVQWRGRRAQWFVGTCFLGAKTLQLVRTSLPYQSDLHPVVPDRLCAALLGRRHPTRSAAARTPSSFDGSTDPPIARSSSNYRWKDSLHSPGRGRWHHLHPQRILEGRQAVGRQICLGYADHPLSTIGNLVSIFCSA